MKDSYDNARVVESSTGHPEANAQSTSKIKYKRFRRRGFQDKAQHADTVSSAAIVNSKRINKSALVSHEATGLREPVLEQSNEIRRWAALRPVTIGEPLVTTPLVSFHRDDPASRAFDQLRTHLLQMLRENGWSRIAIAAPTPGCGSTFTAVNLGLSFARIPGSRILLMDLNLRAPGVAAALGLNCTGDIRSYLSGKIDTPGFLVRVKDTLALGLANGQEQDASELLLHHRTATVLNTMNNDYRPDVTIYDLPPVLEFDDLTAFLPQIDGVLLVSDGTKTTAAKIKACERVLEGRTQILGVVLNRARTKN